MEAIQIFYGYASAGLFAIVVSIIIAHIISWLIPKKPVQLKNNSLVVITGGCMGIGRQMALEIAKLYKCKILIVDRRKELFPKIQKEIETQGATSVCVQTNLSDPKSVQNLIVLLKQESKIDLFIYNAGIVIPKRAYDTTEEEHMLVMRVNYFTPIALIHALTHQLQGGHISVVASMVAIISGGIDYSTYTASKHAIYGYLASLRQQYKKDRKNITISIGCPYAINTTMFQGFKTKFDSLIPILDEKYVGKRLVKEFVQKKQICFIYQYEAILFRVFDWLPSGLIDWIQAHLVISNFKPITSNKEEERSSKKYK